MSDPERLLREALALHHAGRLREAQLLYSRVLADDPENAEALHLSGLVAFREARLDEAIDLLRRAVARAPRNALYLGNLGNALRDSGRVDEASESYERALAIDPAHVSLRDSLGAIKLEAGTTEAAIQDFREVIARKPDHLRAHLNLARALRRTGNDEAAERAYRRALALDPDSGDALAALASLLTAQDRSDEALAFWKRRAVVDSDSVAAHGDLARALARGGDDNGAIVAYQQALAIDPDALDVRCDFCALLQKTCDFERLALHVRDVVQAIAHDRPGVSALLLVLLHDVTPAMQLKAARANTSAFTERVSVPARRVHRGANRRRIGYLCADSTERDTTSSLADLLERHDRTRFEVFVFCHGRDDHGSMRRRLRGGADSFFDVTALSDELAANKIADSAIDILVDVDGNTDSGRMGIAAFRPAPIQASWLGVPCTRGAAWYDYMIADRYVAPGGCERDFAEALARLPDCYQSPARVHPRPAAAKTRAAYGLAEDSVVLCCFGESAAITAPMFALWLRVLAAVPATMLWLRDDNALASASLTRRAAQQGVAPERIVFASREPKSASLARYHLADLAVDTFACASPAAAADALSMGCPLATMAGETFASRVAASFLANLGLGDLVAASPARYEELVIDLARDAVRRQGLRERLHHAVDAMPLFDGGRFVRSLERAYEQMIAASAHGAPGAFDVRP